MINWMRWPVAWLLYWAGDAVSRWNDHDMRFTELGFNLYQWLMRKSDEVQGATAYGPWKDVK